MKTATEAKQLALSKETEQETLNLAIKQIHRRASIGFFSTFLSKSDVNNKVFESLRELGYKQEEKGFGYIISWDNPAIKELKNETT